AVGNDGCGSAAADTAAAQTGNDRVQHRRKYAEERHVPEESIVEFCLAESIPSVPVVGIVLRDGEVAAQRPFEPIGGRGNIAHELAQVRVGDFGAQVEIGSARRSAVEVTLG